MTAFNQVPKHYAGSDQESIAGVMNMGLMLLPIFLLVVLVRQLIQADFDIAIVIGISIIFTLFIRREFKRGKLRKSIISIAFFFTILLTIVCSLGNGINDIGLIGFPIVIGFSGVLLDQHKLAIVSSLSVLGITWLVAGDYYGLYEPIPPPTGSTGDFIVASLLIFIGGFVAFSLTNNMKKSLIGAQKEIGMSKREAENLARETDEKLEIIEEIHRAVINSLYHINHLIEHTKGSSPELRTIYDGLKRKVIVIEVAHKILLAEQAPIMLDLRELTRALLKEYEPALNTKTFQMELGSESMLVRLDLAINYGICLMELLNEADQPGNEELIVKFSLSGGWVKLDLSGFKSTNEVKQGIVMDLLTRQLKGTLERQPGRLNLSFTPTKKK